MNRNAPSNRPLTTLAANQFASVFQIFIKLWNRHHSKMDLNYIPGSILDSKKKTSIIPPIAETGCGQHILPVSFLIRDSCSDVVMPALMFLFEKYAWIQGEWMSCIAQVKFHRKRHTCLPALCPHSPYFLSGFSTSYYKYIPLTQYVSQDLIHKL